LIVENGLHRTMAALIVVALDVPLQLQRIMQRDGLDEAAALDRIQAQAPLSEKLAAADFVIDNGQPLSSLFPKVDSVHTQLLARFAGDATT
jgi:dephospho-CoA kinase